MEIEITVSVLYKSVGQFNNDERLKKKDVWIYENNNESDKKKNRM